MLDVRVLLIDFLQGQLTQQDRRLEDARENFASASPEVRKPLQAEIDRIASYVETLIDERDSLANRLHAEGWRPARGGWTKPRS